VFSCPLTLDITLMVLCEAGYCYVYESKSHIFPILLESTIKELQLTVQLLLARYYLVDLDCESRVLSLWNGQVVLAIWLNRIHLFFQHPDVDTRPHLEFLCPHFGVLLESPVLCL